MFYYYNLKLREFTESSRDLSENTNLKELTQEKFRLWKILSKMNYQDAQEWLDEWFNDMSYSPRCDVDRCHATAIYSGWSKTNDASFARRMNVCEEHSNLLRGSLSIVKG